MKKIILSISIAAIAIAGFMYEPASENQTSNDLTVDNAEALAGNDGPITVACSYYGYCILDGHQYLYDPLTVPSDDIKQ